MKDAPIDMNKYQVTRTWNHTDPTKQEEECEYFVLDVTHDPNSKAALVAYVDSCCKTHPQLAESIITRWLYK